LSKNPNGWHDKLSNTKVIEFWKVYTIVWHI
jgi:hypothetical protein